MVNAEKERGDGQKLSSEDSEKFGKGMIFSSSVAGRHRWLEEIVLLLIMFLCVGPGIRESIKKGPKW